MNRDIAFLCKFAYLTCHRFCQLEPRFHSVSHCSSILQPGFYISVTFSSVFDSVTDSVLDLLDNLSVLILHCVDQVCIRKMAAETLDRDDICKHFRGTCLLFNAAPYEYSRSDLETICHDVHSKGIGRERVVWEMYSSSSGLSCFTVLLPLRAKSKGRITKDSERDYCDSQGTGEDILMSDESQKHS